MEIGDIISSIDYEKRLVVFLDVLGWQSHVDEAGVDPVKVGRLALMPKLLRSLVDIQKRSVEGPKITSFSDCCVISFPYAEDHLPNFIYGISNLFVGSAISGFLMRAGVTIGHLHHTDDVVFGPALNRAHWLESRGVYPRIILDPDVHMLTGLKILPDMQSSDEAGHFVDPYRWDFINSDYCVKDHIPDNEFMGVKTDKSMLVFSLLHSALLNTLEKAVEDRHRLRANWPYLRVREQLKKMGYGGRWV